METDDGRDVVVVDIDVVSDDDVEDGRKEGMNERTIDQKRAYFGSDIAEWRELASAGVVRARVRVRENAKVQRETIKYETYFTCDVAKGRKRVELIAANGERARAEARRGGAKKDDDERWSDVVVTCAFDRIDLNRVSAHIAMNVGGFEIVACDGDGVERARACALTRVERDEKDVLRRFVLPYKAVFR